MMGLSWRHGVGLLLTICWTVPALGQTFNSGSTGALGAFNPASNTTVVMPADGILNYTTVNIPAGVTVTFQSNSANTPVTLLAQGNVTVAGTMNVSGTNAAPATGSGTMPIAGSPGGPGGFAGGQGGVRGVVNRDGTAGRGPAGGNGGQWWSVTTGDGFYGAAANFVSLIPLFGGSGGGGGAGDTTIWGAGGAGGGGGLLIASTSHITISPGGMIRANGGAGNYSYSGSCDRYTGGAGSGGAIRLVAPQITHQGLVEALGGTASCTPTHVGIPGRIRVECTTCSTAGTISPAASVTNTLGPVSAAGTPALVTLPTLVISTIGGMTVPGSPGGAYATADLTLPAGTMNPVTVTLNATNIPVGTIFTIRVLPEGEAMVPFLSTPSTGTVASSTAAASVNLKAGKTNVLTAFVGYSQVAALLPFIDGEPIAHILVAASVGEPSSLSLITTSGKEVTWAQMPQETQLQIAMAFERLHERQEEPQSSEAISRVE